MIRLYKVGGSVRDEVLGLPSKDIDYAVEAPSFDALQEIVTSFGWQIIEGTVKSEFVTLKAKKDHVVADFVLCRKDGFYSDGRRPDAIQVGTIFDDLARRDFTINAMAMDEEGTILDPHNGLKDIKGRVIRCVGDARDRFSEDGLRMLRAIRFSITKSMILEAEIVECLSRPIFFEPRLTGVTIERIREELDRCFRFSTYHALIKFDQFRLIRNYLFARSVWLKPTMEVK